VCVRVNSIGRRNRLPDACVLGPASCCSRGGTSNWRVRNRASTISTVMASWSPSCSPIVCGGDLATPKISAPCRIVARIKPSHNMQSWLSSLAQWRRVGSGSYARPANSSAPDCPHPQPRLPCSRIAAGRHRAPTQDQLMWETTVSYTGLSTLDGKPPRTAPDDWSLKIAPISGLSSRLFGTESHIRSKCRRRSGSG